MICSIRQAAATIGRREGRVGDFVPGLRRRADTDEAGHAFSCVERLWELLRRHDEISVVFSTGWRFEHDLDELRELVSAGGGEDLAARFIDATPLLRHADEAGSREKDCRAWLDERAHKGPWLALDDMPGLFLPNQLTSTR